MVIMNLEEYSKITEPAIQANALDVNNTKKNMLKLFQDLKNSRRR